MISEASMMHGQPWRGEDVAGWHACEKLDGCRGYWDGSRMFSRSGRVIQIPETWSRKLPRMHLDGEIWAGRGMWETTVAAVVRGRWAPHVCFVIFDAPQIDAPWAARLAKAAKRLRGDFAATIPWETLQDLQHAAAIFRTVRLGGGEGLMLWHPTATHSAKRTNHVLKLKKCPLTGELAWKERRFYRAA